MRLKYNEMIAVDVYIENRKTRSFVGRLIRSKNNYRFTYDDKYLYEKTAVSLGPELPLTRKEFTSKKLFESLKDRIPSRQNPAYVEYCRHFGIDKNEEDEMVLLATIGSRGPSSFVFEPVINDVFNSAMLAEYRNKLKLSLRDFGALFDFSPSALSKIEKGHISGRDVLKRVEIYVRFPETAFFEIERNRGRIHTDVYTRTVFIISQIQSENPKQSA